MSALPPDTHLHTFVAAVGDANSPRTWSGIPYHLLEAGRAAGILHGGLPLSVPAWPWSLRRWLWNASRLILLGERGGYQYSASFLETLWRPSLNLLRGNRVINCFQLYAPSVVVDPSIRKWYFIDQTLMQLFDYYGERRIVGRRIAQDAVRRETDGYLAASGVIVHSHWAAKNVRERYGIASERIHVIVPGANLNPVAYERWEADQTNQREDETLDVPPSGALRFVFVGKDWRRKGLDRLLCALTTVRRWGLAATLRVIGCDRSALPREVSETPNVEWVGFIDKALDSARFFDAVATCDVGCLLSRAEAGGIALREYHALGLAVLAPRTGGAPEHADPDASWLVDPDSSVEEIAGTLATLCRDPSLVSRAKATAWRRRHSFLYAAAVAQIGRIMGDDE